MLRLCVAGVGRRAFATSSSSLLHRGLLHRGLPAAVRPAAAARRVALLPALHRSLSFSPVTCSKDATAEAAPMTMPDGLKKFFPEGHAWDEADVGRRWYARELRVKSDEDLHKLWYVLLVERNKLLTVKLEARRLGEEMPNKLRLKKVKQSMLGINQVLRERRDARREALVTAAEEWAALRKKEGLGPFSTVYARPERRPLSEKEIEQNMGVVPPQRSLPGQPQRPMQKRFRTKFRQALTAARMKKAQEEQQAFEDELSGMSDDDVRLRLDDVAQELLDGANFDNLSIKSKATLSVAQKRGFSPF